MTQFKTEQIEARLAGRLGGAPYVRRRNGPKGKLKPRGLENGRQEQLLHHRL